VCRDPRRRALRLRRRGGARNCRARVPCRSTAGAARAEKRRPGAAMTSPYRAELRCAGGCDGAYGIDSVIYRCQRCGELLEVVHDLAALGECSPTGWKAIFEARYKRAPAPYGSGVWGKKEWVAPGIRDENIVSMDEGGTTLIHARRFGAEIGLDNLWVKQCGHSHTGSFKDLGMTVLVSAVKQMIADGRPVRALGCASTGDTSA